MSEVEQRLAERLARRVAMWHDRFEATGDEKYLALAAEADRMYLRVRRGDR